jgi:hypothetical protein
VSGGARTLGGVQSHLAYIGREGELGVEFDYGTRVAGKGFEKQLVLDWDLDLLAHRRQDERSILGKRRSAKLVHNLIFSMPPGTSPQKVLAAVRKLAVNEFAFGHSFRRINASADDGSGAAGPAVRRSWAQPARRLDRANSLKITPNVRLADVDISPLTEPIRRDLPPAIPGRHSPRGIWPARQGLARGDAHATRRNGSTLPAVRSPSR